MASHSPSRSFLQTPAWADFKRRHGWSAQERDGVSFLVRPLPLGQRLLYAPELTIPAQGLPKLVQTARELGRNQRGFVVRLEFLDAYSEARAAELMKLGLRKTFEEVQPEWRQWVDLRPEPQAMLATMKPKGRYNIRLAERHGVTVAQEADPAPFVDLFRQTAARDGFAIREAGYYRDLIETLHKNNVGALFVARHGTEPLAAAIISWFDGVATYLYGASSSEQRELMAPYALHWAAMQEAKKHHCHTYDLLAIAPREGNSKLRAKYAGITRFKEQFGGRTVHLLGSWDLVLRPTAYAAFSLIEQHRRG